MPINPLGYPTPGAISPKADFSFIKDIAGDIKDYKQKQDAASQAGQLTDKLNQQQDAQGQAITQGQPGPPTNILPPGIPPPPATQITNPAVTQQPPLATLPFAGNPALASRYPPLNQLGQPFRTF